MLILCLQLCAPQKIADVENLIDNTINEDTTYQSQPLQLRNQRTYAVKAGINGLLDVARRTYQESNNDVIKYVSDLGTSHEITIDLKYETARGYYLRIPTYELEERPLPDVFINAIRKRKLVECQTLDLVKWNLKIRDSHHEVLQMSDQSVQQLIDSIREDISPFFVISNAIAYLDMLTTFSQLVTTRDYVKPDLTTALGIQDGRHPIIEKIHHEKYIPNSAFATQQRRFQIITGCNMSGKSTFIRSLALISIMAQIGCFVPATQASFPIFHQLFARVSIDDSAQTKASTFSLEMRETAFILRNVDAKSMVIIDELGRGTATRDGLCIAIAVAEALVDSQAFVWFVTHFRELPRILKERAGVVNLHLQVDLEPEKDRMTMLYRVADGCCKDENYGIALAKVVNLPKDVIETAEEVSKALRENAEAKKRSSKTIAIARRRKLILTLREQLVMAKEGKMEGRVLALWLKRLQDEFVRRMCAIEDEMKAAEMEDVEMSDAVTEGTSRTETKA